MNLKLAAGLAKGQSGFFLTGEVGWEWGCLWLGVLAARSISEQGLRVELGG